MTKYNTGNPVGSSDPRDLYDNATVIDEFATSDGDTATDRLGVTRRTIAGIEGGVRDAIANAGYVFVGDYAAGIELTAYNEVVRDTSGEFWRASGDTALPYTTTGAGLPEGGAFVTVGDATLRQDLIDGTANIGGETAEDVAALRQDLIDGTANIGGETAEDVAALRGDLGTAALEDIQTSPTDTTPGRLPVLHDIGGGVGQVSLESLPVATQEQTDEPEGVEALIRADRQWEAPGWKHIASETVDGTAVSAVGLPYDDKFQLYRLIFFSALPDSTGATMRLRFLNSSGSEISSNYSRKQARLRNDTGWSLFSDANTNNIVISPTIISHTGIGNRNSGLGDFVIDRLARTVTGQSRSREADADADGEALLVFSGHCSDSNAAGAGIRINFSGSANIAYGKFVLMGYRE